MTMFISTLNQQPTRLKRPYLWLAWLFIGAVALIPRIVDLNVFYARDELAIWPWADEFATAIWHGNLAGTFTTSDYPGIPMFWVQSLFLAIKYTFPALFPQTMLPFDMIATDRSLELLAERRLAAGLFIGLQIIVAVWMVRRLFGWPTAWLAAIFMGLDPFGLTEARVLRLEMISAYFVCLSLLSYFLYLRERRRGWIFLSGVMAGLGVSSKTSAGLIVPYIWLLLAADFLWARQFSEGETHQTWLEKFRQLILNGLIWAAAAIGAFWVIWPAMWVKPFEAIEYVFLLGFGQAAGRSVWGEEVFFWGQIIEGGDPGAFFYPVVLAFRTTPLAWIGLLSALLFLIISITPRLSKSKTQTPNAKISWPASGALWLWLYIILLMVELTFIISKVDRFLLIVFPAINILSALGFASIWPWLVETLTRRFTKGPSISRSKIRGVRHASRQMPNGAASEDAGSSKLDLLSIDDAPPRSEPHSSKRLLNPQPATRNGLWLTLIGATLGIQLLITLPVHPYYFTYWNTWLGGGRAALDILPLGTGEGIDLAMDYLNNRPNAANSSVVCGASEPWCEHKFEGHTLRSAAYFSGEWIAADYASFYISHVQRQNYPPEVVDFFMQQTPLYQVDLAGATYVWVYDVPKVEHFAGAWNDLAGLGRLLGYAFSPSITEGATGKAGDTIEATIWWINWGGGIDNLVLRWVDETGYEWGRAGVEPWPDYRSVTPEQRAIVAGAARLTIPPGAPPGLYFLRIGVLKADGETILGEFKLPDESDQLVVRPGPIFSNPDLLAIAEPVHQGLAPEVMLLGYTPPAQVLTPDAPAWLMLYWQALAQPPDYQVLLRLLDQGGQEVARWQGRPAHGGYPTANWRRGEIVQDVWALQPPPHVPVGRYDLELSLLNPTDLRPQNAKVKIEALEVWPQPIRYDTPEMQVELRTNFGDRLTLLGYDLYFDTDGAHIGRLSPNFYWQSQADMQAAFDLLLTLRAAGTNQIIKEWRLPLGVGEPKTFWKANEVINTSYQLETGLINQGDYHLGLTLESRASGQVERIKLDDNTHITSTEIKNIQDKIVVRVVN